MNSALALLKRLRGQGFCSLSTQVSQCLVIHEFGPPEKTLRLEQHPIPSQSDLGAHQVLIHMLAAPINPSDINTVEGRYPIFPDLPATPGHEGVGIVQAVGPSVTRLRPGDRCVPIEHSQGTWRSHGVFDERNWYRIPHDLALSNAATMAVNPPTAVRLLEAFVNLKPGDTIIQTGANSAVGKYILQLASHKELRSINLIRAMPDLQRSQVEAELKDLGATVVVTPEQLPSAMKKWHHPLPRLALDCIGGVAATAAARALDQGGTMVVYGAMSRAPVCVPSGHFIFKDIAIRGFWLTGGFAAMERGVTAKEHLVDHVCALFRQRVLRPVEAESFPIQNWKEAFAKYRTEHRDAKILLTMYDE